MWGRSKSRIGTREVRLFVQYCLPERWQQSVARLLHRPRTSHARVFMPIAAGWNLFGLRKTGLTEGVRLGPAAASARAPPCERTREQWQNWKHPLNSGGGEWAKFRAASGFQ